MKYRIAALGIALTSSLFWMASCGGIAVIDGAGGGSSSSSVGSTATGSCECAQSSDCPIVSDVCFELTCDGCGCNQQSLPAGEQCMGGVCDRDGSCVGCLGPGDCSPSELCVDNSCVPDVAAVCFEVCTLLGSCGVIEFNGCVQGCPQDLMDCSPQQVAAFSQCTPLLQDCDVGEWIDCGIAVDCVELTP